MATYAVGDIQGCYEPLQRLLEKVSFDPANDRLWAVGDLVSRGPDSLKVLRFLKSLGSQFTTVLGNHDLHLLALNEGIKNPEKAPTLRQVLDAPDCTELLDWLKTWPLAYAETINEHSYLMVHAGVPPNWSIRDTLDRAAEVEVVLASDHYTDFLKAMYGDLPNQWHDNLAGYERLRFITNSLTRMRFCNADNMLELATKGAASDAPNGYQPWFSYPRQESSETEVIFGHWAALEGDTGDCATVHGLDTGCVWGRQLTLMRLEDQKLFSIECKNQ
ncbi:MAG: symmetrical bis(5'-nucleosyl)-tetraphosphatase [Pseudomonadales bacterium]|nr:symmetrical bis(5'-nucleosyl)-tetraphosphatase [Pseudomonadales bacterium]